MDGWQALDAEAVRRCLDGDPEAFAVLVTRHKDRVHGLCLRMCAGRAADASDLAQETFVRAYRALGRFDPSRPFLPWLLRIAVNVCRDHGRRLRARHEDLVDLSPDRRSDPAPGPENALIREQDRRAVRAAVAELPAHLRVLIALAYDEDLSLGDVARITGLPLTIVKNRLFRARRALAARLAKEVGCDELPIRPGATARARLR